METQSSHRIPVLESQSAAAKAIDLCAGPLLDLCIARTGADGAYLYRLESENGALGLVSWRGLKPASTGVFRGLEGRALQSLLELSEPPPAGTSVWGGWRLEMLPESAEGRFEAGITIPLASKGWLQGIASFGRRLPAVFASADTALLWSLQPTFCSLLGAVFANEEISQLRSELQKIKERLASRNTIERAKGIIQARDGCTEEEAYTQLRRLSRETREPMFEIARRVIERSSYRPRGSATTDEVHAR